MPLLEEQIKYLLKMLPGLVADKLREMKEKKYIVKEASALSAEYAYVYLPVFVPVKIYLELYGCDPHIGKIVPLINVCHQEVNSIPGTPKEVEDIQPICFVLLHNLLTLLKVKATVVTDKKELNFSVKLVINNHEEDNTLVEIKGQTDASLFYNQVCIGTVEVKNRGMDLTTREIRAETLVQIDSTAKYFYNSFGREPAAVCGLLMTGIEYILFTRFYRNGRAMWRQSSVVHANNAEGVAALLLSYVISVQQLMKKIDTYADDDREIPLYEYPEDHEEGEGSGSEDCSEDTHSSSSSCASHEDRVTAARQPRNAIITEKKSSSQTSKMGGKGGAQKGRRRPHQDVSCVHNANALTKENLLMHQHHIELYSDHPYESQLIAEKLNVPRSWQ